jgi:transposase-like protein
MVASLAVAGSVLAADFSGVWKGEVKLPTGQALPFVARLKQDGNTITGKLDGIQGAPDVEVMNGKVQNDTVTFTGTRQINNMPVTFEYTAKFTDPGTLHFDIVRKDGTGAPLESATKRAKD